MIESIKQLWLKALRSGDFQQAQAFLRTGNGHCCLGVLCEVYHQETGKGAWEKQEFEGDRGEVKVIYRFRDDLEDSSLKVLPIAVQKWSGLYAGNPELNAATSAAGMNDEGYTFEEIARAIDENLTDDPL